MRLVLVTAILAVSCLPSPARETLEDAAKVRAEIARLKTELAESRKLLGEVLAGAREAEKFEGTWVIVAARRGGKEIAGERGGEIEFFGNVVFARFPGRKGEIRQRFDVSPSAKSITFTSTGQATETSLDYFHGRYECNGDVLRVSLLGYGVPKDVSDQHFQRLWVLKRKKESPAAR